MLYLVTMQRQYNYISEGVRESIAEMLWERKMISHIVTALNRNKATISRELRRNASLIYQ
jgi:IS30 family transposase